MGNQTRNQNEMRNLLEDAQLRTTLQATESQAEAVQLLLAAGAKKGYRLVAESVAALLAHLESRAPRLLSEQDMLAVSGGRWAEDTHIHMSCCTECPEGQGQCKSA